MKAACVLALLCCVAAATALPTSNIDLTNCSFEEWKAYHGKTYSDATEHATRQAIFEANAKLVAQHNAEAAQGQHTHTTALNVMADLTNEEFRAIYLSSKPMRKTSIPRSRHMPAENVALPDQVDWRDLGYVTPIKNQGQCGSCWAFSTVGSVEGQHYRATQNLVSLSEQQLVDCSHNGNMGCNGGLMDTAFEYIMKNPLDTESSYPYTSGGGHETKVCHSGDADKVVGATIGGFVDVDHGDEGDLKDACATQGPISVAIDASHFSFQLYHGGVYSEPSCSSQNLDHGVLVVGYGSASGTDFWTVKNSWGEQWGLSGYIQMSRNADNQCGIASSASYPTVNSAQ